MEADGASLSQANITLNFGNSGRACTSHSQPPHCPACCFLQWLQSQACFRLRIEATRAHIIGQSL